MSAVVQLQFAGNVVSHLHRMGRCGRAGNVNGRGVVYYSEFGEGELIEVVREAERRQESYGLEQDVDSDPDADDRDDEEREEGGGG